MIEGIKKISLSEYFGFEKIPKKLGILSNSCFSLIHKRPFLVFVNSFPGFSIPSNIIIRSLPLMGRYRVDLLKDGVCYNTGEMYRGCISELGQSVKVTCLDAQGSVTVIVTSNPIQCLDQAHFTYFDTDLTTMQIIGVKSTLHYRADFEHLVDRVVSVASIRIVHDASHGAVHAENTFELVSVSVQNICGSINNSAGRRS